MIDMNRDEKRHHGPDLLRSVAMLPGCLSDGNWDDDHSGFHHQRDRVLCPDQTHSAQLGGQWLPELLAAAFLHSGPRWVRTGLVVLIRLILITAIAAGAAFMVTRLLSRRQSGAPQGDRSEGRQRPGLLAILLVGVICAVIVLYVLPRFGISLMGLVQKLLAFLPLIRAFLPF